MKKNRFALPALILVLLLACGQLTAYEQPGRKRSSRPTLLKKQLCLRGGLGMFNARGADSDYEAGMNDFPVTPAYQSPAIGLSFAAFTSRNFALGLDVRYGLSATVDLRDPSDGETITVDTPKNLTAAVSLYRFFRFSSRLELFVSVGGGMENLMAEEKEYVSDRGSRIIVAAPARALSPLAAGGIGLQAMLSRSLGLACDLQAAAVFRETMQILLSPSLALVLKF